MDNAKLNVLTEAPLQFHLLAGKSIFSETEFQFRQQIFNAWHSLWSGVYKGQPEQIALLGDEFLRQDLIGVLTSGDQIVAMHLYSFFNLECKASMSHHYFNFFNEMYWSKLKTSHVQRVMTMEYFTVLPAFRKSNLGHSLGTVIALLGTQLFGQVQVDAIIAPARNDIKVNSTAYDIGFTCIQENTIQRSFVCDLICCYQGDQHPASDPVTNDLAKALWENRKVHSSADVFIAQFAKLNKSSFAKAV